MDRRLLFLTAGGTAALTVTIAVALFFLLGAAEKSARHSSTQFAAALERNDARLAPPGGADYVGAIRAVFGPVSSARVIDARNKSVNTGDTADTRSFFVADILLRTKRGPAVIELEFDNHALTGGENVSGIYELKPDKLPGDALAPDAREELAAAFATRGGEPANLTRALAALPQPPAPAPAEPPAPDPASQRRHSDAQKRLHCVQNAKGDLTKLQQCAERP